MSTYLVTAVKMCGSAFEVRNVPTGTLDLLTCFWLIDDRQQVEIVA